MLADQLIAVADNPQKYYPLQVHCYKQFADIVARSPRFELKRSATWLIHHLSEFEPEKFLTALKICRMPHPLMWVELSYKDRSDYYADAVARGLPSPVLHETAAPPSRLGYLLEQISDSKIRYTPAWAHTVFPKDSLAAPTIAHEPIVNVCNMAQEIDLSDEFHISEEQRAKIVESIAWTSEHADEVGALKSTLINIPANRYEAGIELEARIANIIPDAMMDLWLNSYRVKPSSIKKLQEIAHYDLRSEWRFVLALLLVLNSRNLVTIDAKEVTYEKLNKQRARKGKAPLLSHRSIHLNPSRIQKHRMGFQGSVGTERADTTVKGHWKLRTNKRTGTVALFWWNEHVRLGGAGVPAKPRRYTLSA